MNHGFALRRQRQGRSRGMASLEVIMTIAVMLPVAGILFFLGTKMCATIYQTIGTLVSWPYL